MIIRRKKFCKIIEEVVSSTARQCGRTLSEKTKAEIKNKALKLTTIKGVLNEKAKDRKQKSN